MKFFNKVNVLICYNFTYFWRGVLTFPGSVSDDTVAQHAGKRACPVHILVYDRQQTRIPRQREFTSGFCCVDACHVLTIGVNVQIRFATYSNVECMCFGKIK